MPREPPRCRATILPGARKRGCGVASRFQGHVCVDSCPFFSYRVRWSTCRAPLFRGVWAPDRFSCFAKPFCESNCYVWRRLRRSQTEDHRIIGPRGAASDHQTDSSAGVGSQPSEDPKMLRCANPIPSSVSWLGLSGGRGDAGSGFRIPRSHPFWVTCCGCGMGQGWMLMIGSR